MERSGLDPGRDGEPARWSALGLDPRPDAVARVRRAACAVLRLWGCDAHEGELSLLVSEVVTNAVRHARTPFDVVLSVDGDTVRCEVRDASPVMPRTRPAGPDAAGGRGMQLVAALATSWGVERDPHGKRVWFELPDSRDAGSATAEAAVRGGAPCPRRAPPHPAVVVLPLDPPLGLSGSPSANHAGRDAASA